MYLNNAKREFGSKKCDLSASMRSKKTNVLDENINFDFQNECKNEFEIPKNYAADPEMGFLAKSILEPYGCTTAMPKVNSLKQISIT